MKLLLPFRTAESAWKGIASMMVGGYCEGKMRSKARAQQWDSDNTKRGCKKSLLCQELFLRLDGLC